MGASRCVVCGELRARRGDSECSVCYLVRCLAEEHVAGKHDAAVNASCIDCTRTPEYVAEIRAHREAMRRQDDAQTALRERRRALYGNEVVSKSSRSLKLDVTIDHLANMQHSRMDHSQCDHERTAKARATCRRTRKSDKITSQ
jgi:hypothetical protein